MKLSSTSNLINLSFENLQQISTKPQRGIHCGTCYKQILKVYHIDSASSVEDGNKLILLSQKLQSLSKQALHLKIYTGDDDERKQIKVMESGQFKGCAVQEVVCGFCKAVVGIQLLSVRQEEEFQYIDRYILRGETIKVLMSSLKRVKDKGKVVKFTPMGSFDQIEESIQSSNKSFFFPKQPERMSEKQKIQYILKQINQKLPKKFQQLEEKFQLLMKQFNALKRVNSDGKYVQHIFDRYSTR